MRMLFINDSYWPNPNALTFAIDYVINYFSKDDDIYILSMKQTKTDQEYINFNNVHCYFIDDRRYLMSLNAKRKLEKHRTLMNQIWYHIISRNGFDYGEDYRNRLNSVRVFRQAKKIINSENIDCIVTVSSPFSSHLLGKRIKNVFPNVYWVVYQLDPYTNNFYLTRWGRRIRHNKEQAVFKKCDAIVQLSCITDYNRSNNMFQKFTNKTIGVTCPGLIIEDGRVNNTNHKDRQWIQGVYIGNIYSNDLLTRLERIISSINDDVRVDVYGKGSERIRLRKIQGHGFISNDEKMNVLEDCDFLVLLGDSADNQVPSKIISYMSTGKPILHIYSKTNDSCTEYLEAYENYFDLPLYSDLSMEDIAEVRDFIIRSKVSESIHKPLQNSKFYKYLDINNSGRIAKIIKQRTLV